MKQNNPNGTPLKTDLTRFIQYFFIITLVSVSISVHADQSLAIRPEHDERHDDWRDKKREHRQELGIDSRPIQKQQKRRIKKYRSLKRERDIRNFNRHEFGIWRSGSWRHIRHDGRLGWWWVVGGVWYFYPRPVYPYPNPYIPYIVVEEHPAEDIGPDEPPPAQNWYFCASADGYYPYVPSCPEGWQVVPSTPPDADSNHSQGASSNQPSATPQW